MRIWHATLIPKLCQKHLCAMWREGLGAWAILNNPQRKSPYRNHPAVKEFWYAPAALYYRLSIVRAEMVARGYNPKPLPLPFSAYPKDVIKEWQTFEEQLEILKMKRKTIKNCTCEV